MTWKEISRKQKLLYDLFSEKFFTIKGSPIPENNLDYSSFIPAERLCKNFNKEPWEEFKKEHRIKNYTKIINQSKIVEFEIKEKVFVMLNPFYRWDNNEQSYISVPLETVEKLVGKQYLLTSFSSEEKNA